eukprot:3930089-Rhodomonas_salina.2
MSLFSQLLSPALHTPSFACLRTVSFTRVAQRGHRTIAPRLAQTLTAGSDTRSRTTSTLR